MKNLPSVPADLVSRGASWNSLSGPERRQLARSLRACGLSYSEICAYLPVPKSTLSGWVSDLELPDELLDAIEVRRLDKDRHRDTQWRRRLEIERIRKEARGFASQRLTDAFFVAGVCLYWAEGSKTRNDLSIVNSDPRILRLFVAWMRAYHDMNARFVLKLTLHEGNDETDARAFWRSATGLDPVAFHKTFIKAPGTGHRRNHLPHGVCQVRVRAAADAWQRTMSWIGVVGSELNP